MRAVTVAISVIALVDKDVISFSPPVSTPLHPKRSAPQFMFFADTAVENESLNFQITPLDGSETAIENAAKFMVDSFWLQSPQQLVQDSDSSNISESAKASLINTQADDLMNKYGERMGRRKLDSFLLAAFDGGDTMDGASSSLEHVQGLVTIEVRLLDRQEDILSADASERMLTQAVASLGPKQRREFKDSSVIDIANQLLPPDITAVCSLSNLCVSPSARRKGLAVKLCREAERLAKEKLGFTQMYLRVEASNEAAKRLYEEKLGYECVYDIESASALRVDGNAGTFVEIESDIVVMNKIL
jgi:ribosomal protein S18 acetylase RimI-like enzyme